MIAPEPVTGGARKVHDFLTVGAPHPLQEAAATALAFPDEYYTKMRDAYARRKSFFLSYLDRAGLTYTEPQGAYYVLVDEFVCKSDVKWIEEVNGLLSEKYIIDKFADKIPGSIPLKCIHSMGFSFDPMSHIYTYFSVTTAMMQLAFDNVCQAVSI